MASVANVKTYNAVNEQREDLSNIIYDISPTSTPFMSNVGRDTADNTYFEWQTDALAAADGNNALVEGADAGNQDFTDTNRVANYTQISGKVVAVSGTAQSVNMAGMRTLLAYNQAKAAKELKRDMEKILLSNQAASAGNSSTARKTAGVPAWLITNSITNGATKPTLSSSPNGYPNAAWTNLSTSTDVAFTETMLKTAIQNVWAEGGEAKILMTGPYNKTVASGFAGIAQQRITYNQVQPAGIIATADVYLSDFGEVSMVPNRFADERFALVLDPEYASVAYLRPFETIDIAQTGDSIKKELVVEYGLRMKAEKAHAAIANLTPSA